MTIASETNRSGPYNGNGVTTAFDYDFRITKEEYVLVIKNVGGAETTLTLGADYTVTGVGDAGGGQIICAVAPATGETITNLLNVPFTQDMDLENQGPYFAQSIEDAFDLAAQRDKQLAEQLRRAVKVPASSPEDGGELSKQLAVGILRLSDSADEIDTVAGIADDVSAVAGLSDVIPSVPGLTADAQQAAAAAAAAANAGFVFDTEEDFEEANIPVVLQFVETAGYYAPGDGGGHRKIRISTPSPVEAWHKQSADGAWWGISEQDIRVEMFGGMPDRAMNVSAQFQAAIDYLNGRASPYNGGRILLGSGIYLAAGLVLKSRVFLQGQGVGATVIEAPNGANAHILTVALGSSMLGWDGLTFDGNAGENPGGYSGVYFEPTANNQGQSFSPYQGKPSQAEYSYKMLSATNFAVGFCSGNGIELNGYCFDVRIMNFRSGNNLGQGLKSTCTDCFFGFGYIEKNGLCGIYGPNGGGNKYVCIKSIWNGRQDTTVGQVAGVLLTGQANQVYGVEVQDNYCDGAYLGGVDNIFMMDSNRNGYKAFMQEDQSSRVHANYRFAGNTRRTVFKGTSFSYASTVGSDGFWTTEYAYIIETGAQFSSFECNYEAGVFNSPPNTARHMVSGGDLLDSGAFSTDGLASIFYDISPKGSSSNTIRIGRSTPASYVMNFYQPGSAVIRNAIGGAGPTSFNVDDSGNVIIGNAAGGTGGKWNTSHLQLGGFHLWIDASGRLRIKSTAPTSDTDGTVVGTQS